MWGFRGFGFEELGVKEFRGLGVQGFRGGGGGVRGLGFVWGLGFRGL